MHGAVYGYSCYGDAVEVEEAKDWSDSSDSDSDSSDDGGVDA
jgi:hypothetical protein